MKPWVVICALLLVACSAKDPASQPIPQAQASAESPPSKSAPEAPAPAPEKQDGTAKDTSASDAYHTDELATRAGYPPGSGALVEVPEQDRQSMVNAAMAFFAAARAEDKDAMRDVSTQLFTTNLIDNLDQYRERFFRGLNPSLESAPTGATPGEVRMPAEGHFEIEVRFGDGTNRRMMMAVESGHWRVNRL
ncbi:MAG: hypothetical protein CL940_06390 [Deltaproteobacteria bacterium]|nr:hypothetical protein [Deltaproteobacteria bacterium]